MVGLEFDPPDIGPNSHGQSSDLDGAPVFCLRFRPWRAEFRGFGGRRPTASYPRRHTQERGQPARGCASRIPCVRMVLGTDGRPGQPRGKEGKGGERRQTLIQTPRRRPKRPTSGHMWRNSGHLRLGLRRLNVELSSTARLAMLKQHLMSITYRIHVDRSPWGSGPAMLARRLVSRTVASLF